MAERRTPRRPPATSRGDRGVEHRDPPSDIGLPPAIQVCLFDLDGVLTRTAVIHAAAWKRMFDDFLRQRAKEQRARFRPFVLPRDFDEYVDGRPRSDGVRTFLAARHLELPEGRPTDPPGAETVAGLARQKDVVFRALLHRRGVRAYPGSVRYVRAARRAGLRCAVVSSSAHARDVLAAAGISKLFRTRIDGIVARREHLRGKPSPATYLEGARRLGVRPRNAAVFEDALAGVAAGRAGRFGYVVGVDRVGQRAALHRHGADRVVRDLSELLPRE
jgi:beta-phosphoglucomutase family hydrolase